MLANKIKTVIKLYKQELNVLQKGKKTHQNFLLGREELANKHGSVILSLLSQATSYSERLELMRDIVAGLADDYGLNAFSYPFLQMLSSSIWGLSLDVKQQEMQKALSYLITFATIGKNLNRHPNAPRQGVEAVCVALQYLVLFIDTDDIYDNAIVLIDRNHKFLPAALMQAYDALPLEERDVFIHKLKNVAKLFHKNPKVFMTLNIFAPQVCMAPIRDMYRLVTSSNGSSEERESANRSLGCSPRSFESQPSKESDESFFSKPPGELSFASDSSTSNSNDSYFACDPPWQRPY